MSHVGIQIRHARGCPAGASVSGRCKCKPGYRAEVWDARAGKKVRETFPTIAAAKAWRADTIGGVRRGTTRATDPITVTAAANAWLVGAEDGTIRNRSRDRYKPSALRSYRAALEQRILPEFGSAKLSAVRRRELQEYADRLGAEGLDPSTIRNILMPVRAIYRRAIGLGDIVVNPTTGLELPAVRGKRDRIASPDEATKLLAALPERDRALWATAMLGGLRRGELMALRHEDVDLHRGVIRVERSWDVKEGNVDPKSNAGRRTVPIASVLREHLAAHVLLVGRREGLLFGRTATTPFSYTSVLKRAATAWKNAKPKPLAPIGMHECRHTFASLMIAAGVNAKALSSYMGHSSVLTTLDRYGHLMPGNEDQAATLLDAYLTAAATPARADGAAS